MRLHVRMFRAKKFFGPLDRQSFHPVDVLAPAVIALARISFRVFVSEDRSRCFHHRLGNEILRRNQFQPGRLSPHFVAQRFGDFRIDLVQRAVHFLRRVISHFFHLVGMYGLGRITTKLTPAATLRIGAGSKSMRVYRSVGRFAIRGPAA